VLTHYNLGGFIDKLAAKNKTDVSSEFKTILESVKFHKNKLGNRKVCKIKAPYKKVSNEKLDNTDEILGIKKNDNDIVNEFDYLNNTPYWIEEGKLSNAPIQLSTYKQILNVILDNWGTGQWIPRVNVIDKMCKTEQEKSKTRGTLSYIMYKGIVSSEDTNGLVIKKSNNIIYLRIN
jgi:hypothetical protein